MAKPKGGTLTRLFEVSEQERQQFYQNIQKKIQPIEEPEPQQEAGISPGVPEKGIPETGIPEKGIPETGIPEKGTPPVIPSVPRHRIRRAYQVQDGHSLGEQLVLTSLWNDAPPIDNDDTYRRITIGYRTLSVNCGLTVNNCKANLKSLQAKLAIEPEASHSTTSGTTYRVFSFAEILRRREAAGLTHVYRTRGVQFVDPEKGTPLPSEKGIPETGTPPPEKGIPETGTPPVPFSGTLPIRILKEGLLKEEYSASVVGVVSCSLRKHLNIDDAAVRRIIESCRQLDPQASPDEIVHFAEVKLRQYRKNPNVQNLPGLLIHSVCDYFQPNSGELADYRAAVEQERQRSREVARQVLDNPESTPEERQWAEEILQK